MTLLRTYEMIEPKLAPGLGNGAAASIAVEREREREKERERERERGFMWRQRREKFSPLRASSLFSREVC